MKKGRVSFTDMIYIDENANSLLWKSEVKPGMILLSMSGTIGDVALASDRWQYPINSNQDIAKIDTKGQINPYYLYAFLMSEFGQNYLKRETRGSVQQHVFLSQIELFEIPVPSKELCMTVEKIIKSSDEAMFQSEEVYQQAEDILTEVIGLKNYEISKESTNVKSLSNSFFTSGRLDAEYYQPKYEEIENRIKYNNEWNTIGNLLEKIDTGEYSPEYFKKGEIEGLTFYIRSTNIKNGQIEFDDDYYVKKDNFVRKAKEGDIVTARVGSVGIFGEIRKELQDSVYSDNVLSFRLPKKFIPSVYTLLFNSKFYFELIDRLARGSVQQRLNQETLKDLIIPIIPYNVQEHIAALIEESFSLKKYSETLLETAKNAVEISIEQDEASAISFIDKYYTHA
ncbi:restriction endonuclease subunit S [Bacillus sp. Marseille-P3661]|uniref:restriction endonuclease subunit S n=1 Tax=Bacillus sp. Marseille-P3661 TaxID=1936234 RepID=UPI00115C1C70|nr:restriction endonuclease subunit S [Bacillus sp. Marseille-P3661]